MLSFRDLTLEDRLVVDTFFQNAGLTHSDLSFTDLYIWRYGCPVQICLEGEMLYLSVSKLGQKIPNFLIPLGDQLDKKQALARLKTYCAQRNWPLSLFSVPEAWAKEAETLFGQEAQVLFDRDFSDYVYTQEALSSLSGKKLHAKKNHLNRFNAANTPSYRELGQADLPACLAMFDQWLSLKEDTLDYTPERKMVIEAFSHLHDLPLRAAGIFIEEKLVAFTVGEVRGDTAVIHVEKALPTVRGLFAAINQYFAARSLSDMTYINREEDMGIEGLRQAKESYQPAFMIPKYIVRFSVPEQSLPMEQAAEA